jgi:hypothetical protein
MKLIERKALRLPFKSVHLLHTSLDSLKGICEKISKDTALRFEVINQENSWIDLVLSEKQVSNLSSEMKVARKLTKQEAGYAEMLYDILGFHYNLDAIRYVHCIYDEAGRIPYCYDTDDIEDELFELCQRAEGTASRFEVQVIRKVDKELFIIHDKIKQMTVQFNGKDVIFWERKKAETMTRHLNETSCVTQTELEPRFIVVETTDAFEEPYAVWDNAQYDYYYDDDCVATYDNMNEAQAKATMLNDQSTW